MERSAHPDEAAVAEEFVSRLEANALAKVEAEASMTAVKTVEGILDVLEMLGIVSRKG